MWCVAMVIWHWGRDVMTSCEDARVVPHLPCPCVSLSRSGAGWALGCMVYTQGDKTKSKKRPSWDSQRQRYSFVGLLSTMVYMQGDEKVLTDQANTKKQ